MMKNNKGSALINVLAILSLISIISAGVFTSLTASNKKYSNAHNYAVTVSLISEQVFSIIDNEQAWLKTIQLNPSMACMLSSGNTCANTPQAFDLYLPDGTLYLSPTGGTGFSRLGFKCTAYSDTAPDFRCVYKVKLYWQCAEADCTTTLASGQPYAKKPKINIALRFFYNSSVDGLTSELSLNSSDLIFERGGKAGAVKAFCESVSGTLLAGGLHCRLNPIADTNCRVTDGMHMVDRLENGSVKCMNPINYGQGGFPFLCSSGSAIAGFADDHPWCDVF